MTEQTKSYWDDGYRDTTTGRFPPAWKWRGIEDGQERSPHERDDTLTLEELVNAVVIGRRIEHNEIPDLRVLIDAVQKHPDAKLAKLDPITKKSIGVFDSSDNKLVGGDAQPTEIVIESSDVLECNCNELEVGCKLNIETRFISSASFQNVHFTTKTCFTMSKFCNEANFQSSHFADDVFFRECHFANVVFTWSRFKAYADFCESCFQGSASFHAVHFDEMAYFRLTQFDSESSFMFAHFNEDAHFEESQINGLLDFTEAIVERRIFFNSLAPKVKDTKFDAEGRLKLNQLIVRSGAAIEMSAEQLGKPHKRSHLIWGEDSDKPEELASARDDYHRLRDIFQNQPASDDKEEICNFKYQDLKRRAQLADPNLPWYKRAKLIVGDWLIMRNALGYLIQWHRIVITGFILILFFATLYWTCGNDSTLQYAGYENVAEVHSFWNSLYYSVVTFTSLGYGDIHPMGWFKGLAACEALFGVALMALFVVAWARKMVR